MNDVTITKEGTITVANDAPVFTRDGYAFVKWGTSADCSTTVPDSAASSYNSGTTNLYAIWKPTTPDAPIATVAGDKTMTLSPAYGGEGYQYQKGNGGWVESGAFSSLTNGSALNYFIRFKATVNSIASDASEAYNGAPCAVTYNNNGGDVSAPATAYIAKGMKYTNLPSYSGTKADCTINSTHMWATGKDGSGPIMNGTTFNGVANITLYVAWKHNAPATPAGNPASVGDGTINHNTESGTYEFSINNGNTWAGSHNGLTNDVTYGVLKRYKSNDTDGYMASDAHATATQTKICKIAYNMSGGSGVTTPVYKVGGVAYTLPDASNITDREGYTDTECLWYENQNMTGTSHALGSNYTPSESTTLYLKWVPHTYTISFAIVSGGHTISKSQITATYDKAYEINVARNEISYAAISDALAGWKVTGTNPKYSTSYYSNTEDFGSPSGITDGDTIIKNSNNPSGTIYVKNLSVTKNGAVTLTAQVMTLTYNVKYANCDGNGGSTTVNDVTYGSAVTRAHPTYNGHTFRGWKMTSYDNDDSANALYEKVATNVSTPITKDTYIVCDTYGTNVQFKNLSLTNSSTVTLTAQWAVLKLYFTEGVKNVTYATNPVTSGTTIVPNKAVTWQYETGYELGAVTNLTNSSGNANTMLGDVVITAKLSGSSQAVPVTANKTSADTVIVSTAPNAVTNFVVEKDLKVEIDTSAAAFAGKKVEVVLASAPAGGMSDRYRFDLAVEDSAYAGGATMTVTLPYSATRGTAKIYYDDGLGNYTLMPIVGTDLEKGTISFTTTHNSFYVIMYSVPGSTLSTVKVSFNTAGGEISEYSKTCASGKYGDLPIPTRSGYAFMGWTYNGDSVSSDMSLKTYSAHTLDANWAPLNTEPDTNEVGGVDMTIIVTAIAAMVVIVFAVIMAVRFKSS